VRSSKSKVLVVQHGEKERQPGDPGLTSKGLARAEHTARWIAQRVQVHGVWSSPMRRAIETARPIVAATKAPLTIDSRLRERMNWDDDHGPSLAEFLAEWEYASSDRSYVPRSGDSSHEAADRFLSAVEDMITGTQAEATLVVVAHGGVTVDALRTLIGDQPIRQKHPTLIGEGIPSCAITTLEVDDDGSHPRADPPLPPGQTARDP
jgi:broad specificity phosphatase PhoE